MNIRQTGDEAVVVLPQSFPQIVTLCGSTRFYEAWQKAIFDLTMQGEIVHAVGFYPHSAGVHHGEGLGITAVQKVALDLLHKRKIDLSDYIFVLNYGGYVGDSTRFEIAYAREKGIEVRWLEPDKAV